MSYVLQRLQESEATICRWPNQTQAKAPVATEVQLHDTYLSRYHRTGIFSRPAPGGSVMELLSFASASLDAWAEAQTSSPRTP